MIQKPKYLTGEVKEFIDHYLYHITDTIRYNETMNFYKQPFQPEMITEYLLNWEKSKENAFKMYVNIYELDEIIIQEDNILIGEYKFPMPKTFGQFITNCIQAGIKLEWK